MLHASHCLHQTIAHNITIPITHGEKKKARRPVPFSGFDPETFRCELSRNIKRRNDVLLEELQGREMQRPCTFVTASAGKSNSDTHVREERRNAEEEEEAKNV